MKEIIKTNIKSITYNVYANFWHITHWKRLKWSWDWNMWTLISYCSINLKGTLTVYITVRIVWSLLSSKKSICLNAFHVGEVNTEFSVMLSWHWHRQHAFWKSYGCYFRIVKIILWIFSQCENNTCEDINFIKWIACSISLLKI